jgi:beta-N-acetylhexosaminidase
LFIAVDQEGGQVARLKEPFTQFPGNPHMVNEEDAIYFAEVTATELTGVGINMNMAPVMDVAPKEINGIMAKRAFGDDPAWVTRLGVKVIEHLQHNNIMAVAKHFPGIGRTILDSHMDLPMLEDEISVIERMDLIPFKASIQHGVSGMMLSHIFYKKLDPQWPASLSDKIAKVLLRKKLGFDGIVLTDDLDMGAIVKHYDIQTAIRRILAAEIDVALICHKGPNIETAYEELLQGITDSAGTKTKGIESVERIMKLKKKYLQPNPDQLK